MRVGLIAEGTYPYITGGVSSWIQTLISNLPEFEFEIYHLRPDSKKREVRYKIPKNVVRIHEVNIFGDFDPEIPEEANLSALTEITKAIVLSPKNVLVFIDTKNRSDRFERQRKDSPSRENPLEAQIVKEVVEKLLSMGVKEDWIGIITPYDDQVNLIRELIEAKVEVHSVDGFQGREKEVIIISFVRSNKNGEIGFLEDLRRLNVSLTRAKRKLIATGDSSTLSVHPTYRRFVEFVKKKGTYVIF